MNYVDDIAKIIFKEHYSDFANHFKLLCEDPSEYSRQGLDEKYGYGKEDKEEDEDYFQYNFFQMFCNSYEITTVIDWSGEDDESHLKDFIAEKLASMNVPEIDLDFIDEWESKIDLDSFDYGEFIKKKFSIVGSKLEKHGIKLSFLNTGHDCYLPFLVNASEYITIPKENPDQPLFYVHDYSKF
jgi:hypothetical protein